MNYLKRWFMSNKFLYFSIIFLVMFFIALDSDAQFYQYKDKNGAIVYTDDVSKIPLDQRDSVKTYSSSENTKPSEKKEEAPVPTDKAKVLKTSPPTDNFDTQREALYKEYESLTKDRDQLIKEQEMVKTPSKQEAYNKKVNQLNENIEAFKARIKEFNIKASQ